MAGNNTEVLVIGAGVAGIEASLLLSQSGRRVHLVEKSSFTGGMAVLFEQVFPTFECATCMLSPRQQEVLQDSMIDLLTLSEVQQVEPVPQGFRVKVLKMARFIDANACIGCGACYEPCPISVPNEVELGLATRKAVYVPFAGSLPNVPQIDKERCLHFKGESCQACKDACVFEAIDLEQKDELVELEVGAIIVATGSTLIDLRDVDRYGYGKHSGIYSALELERLFSSNGPTGGNIVQRDGKAPRSVALVHCAGREEQGFCSSVCCLYLLKFNRYLRSKLPDCTDP